MKLVSYAKDERKVTLELSDSDMVDIDACIGYLISTLPRQDMTAMNFPGERGKIRLNEISGEWSRIVKELNKLTIPGHSC